MKIVSLLSTILTVFAIFMMEGCSRSDHRASYSIDDNTTISIELSSSHHFLAEYDRFLILSKAGKKITRQKLFSDSGGYSSANLYKCDQKHYMVKGYFDMWIVNLSSNTITEGQCSEPTHEYVGIFDGGGSKPWKFYTPSKRKEKKLEPKGG